MRGRREFVSHKYFEPPSAAQMDRELGEFRHEGFQKNFRRGVLTGDAGFDLHGSLRGEFVDHLERGLAADFIEGAGEIFFFALGRVGVFEKTDQRLLIGLLGSCFRQGGHGIAADFFIRITELLTQPSRHFRAEAWRS